MPVGVEFAVAAVVAVAAVAIVVEFLCFEMIPFQATLRQQQSQQPRRMN